MIMSPEWTDGVPLKHSEHRWMFSNRINYTNRVVWIHYCVCTVTVKATGLTYELDGCRFPIPESVSREEAMNFHLGLQTMFDPVKFMRHEHFNVDGQ